jgi:hypothetical protein
VQLRCERLIPAAAADDFEARVATFLADAGGKYSHDLPGWNEFRAAVGKAADAREVFAGVVRTPANRELLAGLAVSREEFARRLQARKQELASRLFPARGGSPAPQYDPPLEDALSLLFADTLTGDGPAARAGGPGLATGVLFARPKVGGPLRAAPEGSAVRVLLGKWADSREAPASLFAAMRSATAAKLPGVGRKLAAKLLATKGVPPLHRGYGALALGQLGGKDELPALAAAMADDGVIHAVPNVGSLQVRDVALAVAALVSGRTMADLGFEEVNGPVRLDGFNLFGLRFKTDEDRSAAFARWASLEPKLVPSKKPPQPR